MKKNFDSTIIVKYYRNIDNCLRDCNYIFAILDESIPNESINYIKIKSR